MTWLGRLGAPLLVAASAFAVVMPDRAQPADAVVAAMADAPRPDGSVDASPVVAPGRARFDDVRVGHVDSPVTGRGAKFHGTLDPTSALLEAQAEVIAAQHDWERQMTLYAACGVRADLDAAAARLRDAKAKLVGALPGHLP